MARITTARAIVRSLVANGIDTVFGLPGVQLDALFNALHDERDRIRVIHPRHEQAAAYMALGYAQASAKIGALGDESATPEMSSGPRQPSSGLCTLAGPALLCALLALPGGTYAQVLTVSSWGGPYGESQRRAYFEPFAATTGIQVVEDHWGGDLDKVRAMVVTGRYQAHVLDAESSDVVQGCADGILEPIDYARLGLSPVDMLPGAVHPCGVGNVAWSMVLVFDRARLGDNGPRDWTDFFDVTRFEGGRGLRLGALGNLEIALMADGVVPGSVYPSLRTREGVDRAFAKLATLLPDVTWWEAGRQPARLLDDAQAVMTTAWNGRIGQSDGLRHRRFEIVWRGQILDFGYWVIPKDHPRTDLALRFVAFAIRPDRQAELARRIPYGPLRRAAFAHVDLEHSRRLPTAPENLDRWLKLDADFWIEHREALERRFRSLVSRSR